MIQAFETLLAVTGIIVFLGVSSYVVAWARGAAENKTKRICDVCFRDIAVWNEKIKELKNNQSAKS